MRVAAALLLTARLLTAQSPAPPASLPSGWSVFVGPGWSILSGGPVTSNGGGGSIGLASERPIGAAITLRQEVFTITATGGIGAVGDPNPAPATLSTQRFATGVGIRRYSPRLAYVGLGATVTLGNVCFVDIAAAATAPGQSLECAAVTDRRITPVARSIGGVVTAGVTRGRWNLELRYDQGLGPAVRTDRGTVTAANVGAMALYRIGRAAREAGPVVHGPRATPPLSGQLRAGMLGWAGGAVAGLLVGAAIADRPGEDWTPLLTAVLGTFVGTPIGVHRYGARHGIVAHPIPTIVGTILGAFGGPAAPYTMPLGAVIGYNTTSRER